MSREQVIERIRELQQAREAEPRELATVNSPSSVRGSGHGLATVPYLTINDIIALRGAGMRSLDDIERRLLEVPEGAWRHILELVRDGVIRVEEGQLDHKRSLEDASDTVNRQAPRCLALTKEGARCRNRSREGSKYCSSHKGYRPSSEEITARERGLLPDA